MTDPTFAGEAAGLTRMARAWVELPRSSDPREWDEVVTVLAHLPCPGAAFDVAIDDVLDSDEPHARRMVDLLYAVKKRRREVSPPSPEVAAEMTAAAAIRQAEMEATGVLPESEPMLRDYLPDEGDER